MELFVLILILALPGPVFTVWNLSNLLRKKENTGKFEILAFTVGILYSLFLYYAVWTPRAWDEGIYLYEDMSSFHEFVSGVHAPTIWALTAAGLVSYAYLKAKKEKTPLASVLAMAGVYIGISINALLIVQLFGGKAGMEGFSNAIPFDVLLMMLVPFNYLLLAVQALVRTLRGQSRRLREETESWRGTGAEHTGIAEQGDSVRQPYGSSFLNGCHKILVNSDKWALYALLLVLPVLCVVLAVLLLFGQKPDSVIRAFTETSDWTLSTKISPPPVVTDAHYLCTVALRGHEKLVKPARMGLRRGEKIVVNRQLCVANAFEQLLEERTPRFHRALRNFYDTCGYPVSRYIRTPLAADAVYLLMKPLEWFFLAVLYLFDTKPENRIAVQYLPFPKTGGVL